MALHHLYLPAQEDTDLLHHIRHEVVSCNLDNHKTVFNNSNKYILYHNNTLQH